MSDVPGARPWRLLVATLVAGLILTAGPAVEAAESLRIVIGRISEKPRNHFERLRALADYLAEEMAADGVTGVDVVLVDSLDEMQQMLASGRVDILSETAFMALALEEAGVAELALREWKQGVAEYHAVFFARADAGVEDIDSMFGRTIAFEDPGSTSAYLLPRLALESAGIEVLPADRLDGTVPDDAVGYVFAEGEVNVVVWVHRGLADVGVVSNLDWASEDEAPAFLKDDLVIVHETAPIIRSLLLMRTGLPAELKSRIADILLHMHETEAGRRALMRYFSVSRYDPIDDAAEDSVQTVRDMRRLMQQ